MARKLIQVEPWHDRRLLQLLTLWQALFRVYKHQSSLASAAAKKTKAAILKDGINLNESHHHKKLLGTCIITLHQGQIFWQK